MRMAPFTLPLLLALTACGESQVERIDFQEAEGVHAPTLTPSPDSEGANWSLAADGMTIGFGKDPQAPYLSLACELSQDEEPRITVIRHAPADPGAKALFAVLGESLTARLNLDAEIVDGDWQWQGSYPASSPQITAFASDKKLQATLPGAGTIDMPASPLPAEFIAWCSAGGRALEPQVIKTQTPD